MVAPSIEMATQNLMKFAHRYKLLRDTPTHSAGSVLSWRGDTQRFYFDLPCGQYELPRADMEGPKFSVEQVQDTKWFEPIEPLVDFIPPFPSSAELHEYIYLLPDCRLVDDVDVCRAINTMLANGGFRKRLYEFYRNQYNSFHGLT